MNKSWPVDQERIDKGLYWQEAWKLVEGCTYVSAACDNCWSARETQVRAGQANQKISAPKQGLIEGGRFNGQIRLREDNLNKPFKIAKPAVFAIWNDLFHEDVPFDFILKAFDRMEQTPWHTYLVLTKRPKRIMDFCYTYGIGTANRWPLNIIPGTSVEDQPTADERIVHLLKLKGCVPYIKVYVSYEPALGPVDFRKWLRIAWQCSGCHEYFPDPLKDICPTCGRRGYWTGSHAFNPKGGQRGSALNWIIMGGESGPGARPMHPDWARSVRDQCKAAGVPFFFKQWGEYGTRAINMSTGEPVFRMFENFQQWTHKGDTWINGGVCVDMTGKLLKNGKDMQEAVYPVAILHRVGKARAGCLLDGKEHKETP